MTLLASADKSPIELLYDQYEVAAHMGQGFVRELNVLIGTMERVTNEAGVVLHYQINPGMEWFVITKQAIWLFFAVAVVMTFAVLARFSGTTAGGAPRGFANFLEPLLMFIRDEIVRPNVRDPHHHHGHDHDHGHGHGHEHKPTHKYADKMLPYFCTLFIFLATINLLGLIPGSATPTSNITFTGTMAAIVLIIYVIGGVLLQKPPLIGFLKNLVPACPIFLWPLMFVLEIIGLLAKPFALTVRLFANMTAGHCILLSLAALSAGAVAALGGAGLAAGGLSAIAATGIYGLEVFIALLQAYIFTYLSAIFIGSYLVPEH